MEISLEGYFDILFDQDPHYEDEVEEDYDLDRPRFWSIVRYGHFKTPDHYRDNMLAVGRKILHQFKLELSKNLINNNYLESYLDELKTEIGNFNKVDINGKQFLRHKESYITSIFKDGLGEQKLDLNIFGDGVIEKFIAYNRYRYEVIQYMIEGIESILSKSASNQNNPEIHDDSWKLELNKSTMSDIALLFRLLEENKVFSAKHKTHIFRVIQNSFKGSDRLTFNVGSIKNAFNEPDSNSVKNLEILLANMKTSLKNI